MQLPPRFARCLILLISLLALFVLSPAAVEAEDEQDVPDVYMPMIINGPGLELDPAAMVVIPAGPFQMGCSPDDTRCGYGESPLHTVTLDAYSIDMYEVTTARYAACVAAGACIAPASTTAFSSVRGSYEYYGVAAYANFPVIFVDWFRAQAFCAWEGKRLPTEAEWEKAARGDGDTRIYPWGNQAPDCTRGNFYDEAAGTHCAGETTAVGSYPAGASPYGVMDMSGNVWEWVNDWFQSDYYSISPPANPQGPATGDYRVLRGGSWYYYTELVRVSLRSFDLDGWYDEHGFRCARSQ